jgi:hypothetical protein
MRGTNERNGRTKGLRGVLGQTRRWSALGLGSGAALVAMAMIMAPIASAHTPVTYSAPYLRAVMSNSLFKDVGGCAKLTATKLHFSTVTGMGTWAAKASAHACAKHLGPVGGSGFSESEAQTLIGVPIKSFHGAATPTTVAVTWSITAAAAISTTMGASPCPPAVINPSTGYGSSYCYLEASASMYGYSYLVDLTNGSYFYSSNYPTLISLSNYTFNDTYCYSFTCYYYNYSYGTPTTSFSGSTTATWWINGTLNHADKYAVETYVYAFVYAGASGFPKSSAAASLDMASGSNGETLTSIVVS